MRFGQLWVHNGGNGGPVEVSSPLYQAPNGRMAYDPARTVTGLNRPPAPTIANPALPSQRTAGEVIRGQLEEWRRRIARGGA